MCFITRTGVKQDFLRVLEKEFEEVWYHVVGGFFDLSSAEAYSREEVIALMKDKKELGFQKLQIYEYLRRLSYSVDTSHSEVTRCAILTSLCILKDIKEREQSKLLTRSSITYTQGSVIVYSFSNGKYEAF